MIIERLVCAFQDDNNNSTCTSQTVWDSPTMKPEENLDYNSAGWDYQHSGCPATWLEDGRLIADL